MYVTIWRLCTLEDTSGIEYSVVTQAQEQGAAYLILLQALQCARFLLQEAIEPVQFLNFGL
jgi:hypothetical protein